MMNSMRNCRTELGDGRKLFYAGVYAGGKLFCHPVYALDVAGVRDHMTSRTNYIVSFVVRVVRWK